MENSRASYSTVFVSIFSFCILPSLPVRSQPSEDERGIYIGTMVAVPFAQQLYHQASFSVADISMTANGDLDLGYGIGFAAVSGKGISDHVALELTGAWARQPSDLVVTLPRLLILGLSRSGLELPSGFDYGGEVEVLQSKVDLLVYPVRMGSGRDDGAKPYLGVGMGIVRSDLEMDMQMDDPTRSFISALGELGAADLVPMKVDEIETNYQLTLRAGLNFPFSSMDLDLGWQFYRTYVRGKDNNSHVAGGILKYDL